MKRRILSIIITFALCLGMCPPVAMAAEEVTINNNTVKTLTAEDGGCQGHTFTGTAPWAGIYVESGVHNVTFSGLNITASAMVGVAPGAAMNLTIEGTNTISAATHCAGIYVPVGATLVINGTTGSLNVSGTGGGAGIGGATYASDEAGSGGDPNCGTVEINGGTITATGGNLCAAGIGGGIGTEGNPGNGGTVTINGGTVTATGGNNRDGYYSGAGIGGGGGVLNESSELVSGSGGTLTINGGHVTLAPGQYDSTNSTAYGFGRGSSDPNTSAGTCELTLADASYLGSSTTLDPKGKYTINGDPTADMIVVPEDLIYSGKAQELAGRIYIDDSKTGTGTYFGQTFTVNASAEGWVLQDLGDVKEAGEYTATFKKGDKEISKKFTVAKSGTQFVEDGKVKTYKDGAECSDFTAGDTITVKATPTATGAAPQKAAARLRADPAAGQMALFVGNVQVSEPVGAGEDGSYTMEVSAADVLLAAGGPGAGITLTAKFIGNDNMADGAGTATVNITAAAKAERDGTLLGYYGESNLASAFAEENDGATVTLLADVTVSQTVMVGGNNGSLTLLGVGHTITADISGSGVTAAIWVQGGSFEISNCKVNSADGGILVTNGTVTITDCEVTATNNVGVRVVGGEVTINGGSYSGAGASSAAGVYAANGTVTIEDGTFSGTGESEAAGVFAANGTVTIEDGTFSGTGKSEAAGVFVGSSTVTIKGGAFTGDTYGLYRSAGAVHLTGGTFTGKTNAIKRSVYTQPLSDMINVDGKYYAFYKDSSPITLEENATQLGPGTVTVGLCEHEGGLVPNANGYQHGGPCKWCGAVLEMGNHTTPTEGKCTECGAKLVAKVGGAYYTTIETAWTAAATAGTATVTLLDNVTVDFRVRSLEVKSGQNITFEGGNFTLAGNSKYPTPVIQVRDGGKLTVSSGTVEANSEVPAVISSGEFVMTGGTVKGLETSAGIGLVNDTGGTAQLSGGSFIGGKNAIAYGTGGEVKNALVNYGNPTGPHYAFYQDGKPYAPSGNSLPGGTFIVQECQHTGVTVQDQGNGKHGLTCPYCGYHYEHTTALTATASGNNVTLNGGCGTEGCRYQTTLGTASFTFPKVTYGQSGDVTCTWDRPAGYYVGIEVGERKVPFNDAEVSLTLAQLFGSTKVTAGKHKLKVSFSSDASVRSNACELDLTIDPAPLTPSITGTATKTYDGTTNCDGTGLPIALDGVVNGDTVTAAVTSYAYDNANAGENKTITASGITLGGADADNYTLSSTTATTTGTITKATVSITWGNTTQTMTYSGTQATITVPTVSAENGVTVNVTPEYSYAAQGGTTFTLGLPTNAGTYTVRASTVESGNLTAAQADMTLTINKAPLTIASATAKSKTYDKNTTATVEAVTFDGLKNGETLALGTDFTVTGTFADADAGEGKSVTVTVTLADTAEANNYQLSSDTYTVSSDINRASSTITTAPTASGITYGQALSGSALTDGAGSVAGAFTWTDGTVKPNAGTAQHEVTFTPTDTNYNTATVNVSVTVAKATPDLTAPTASAIEYGQKLSDSTLTGGTATNSNGSAAVAGSWSWANENTQPTAGGSFPVAFVPSDTANYNTPENVAASVAVNAAAPKITLTVPAYQVAGGEVKVTCTVENPHDAAFKEGIPETVTLTYQIGNGTVETLTGTSFNIPEGTAKDTVITVTASTAAVSGKYTAATKTALVTVTDKIPVEISGVTVTGRAYNGKPIDSTGTPVIKTLDGENVTDATVTYSWSSDTPPTNAGDYTLTVAVSDGKYIGSTTVNFTIEKATVTITAENKSALVGNAQPELTYTVSGLADDETLATAPTLTCTPDMNTAGSYPITASGAAVPNTSNYNENITYVEGTLTVTAKPSSGGSSGGSTTPSQPVTTGPSTGDGASSTQTTATPTATTQGGTSTASVSTSMGNEIVKQAVENKSETVVIAPQSTGSATKTEVSIPASTVGQIGSQTSASLTVSTSVADVTIPNGGLGSLASAGGTVTVTAEQSGDTVELTVTAGGKTVENIPGGVTLTVPAASTTPGTVAMLVHEDGTREVVRKSVAGETSVTIPLDGSAKLVIADNSKHFDDVPASSWAADAVAFASAHELFNGTAPGRFSPGVSMSRGMLAVVLYNLESNPEQAVTGIFGDVDNDQWYAEGVAWAAENGIVSGYGNGQFGPNDAITREQLAAMLWRYAGKPQAASTTLSFADADKVSNYAKPALLWAAEKGIVNGKGGGILDPLGTATRAEVAQMLKNFLK